MDNISDSHIKSSITEASICLLVDAFYAKVKADPQLGPIFLQAIGNEPDAWKEHLHKMYSFWSSVMLSSGRYRGNPLKKHIDLPPFNPAFFERWLELFAETANVLHPPMIAASYIEKSKRIAESISLGVQHRPVNDSHIPTSNQL